MIAREPIPDTLYWLALARFAQIGMTPRRCDVCPAPVAWVIITAYAAGEGSREFRTHLCGEHATVFLEALTDRVGARDA